MLLSLLLALLLLSICFALKLFSSLVHPSHVHLLQQLLALFATSNRMNLFLAIESRIEPRF